MKKSVIFTLCIVLCLALTLGGTIAYLKDFDGDVNVMTLGQVKLEVIETQRDGDTLTDFQDDKPLYPIVGDIAERDPKYGMPTNPLFVDKIVQVVSHSSNADAYMRVFIGVPSAVLNVGDTGEYAVHLLWGKDATSVDNWPWAEDVSQRREVIIDGLPYTMLCFNYTKLFTPGEVTEPLLTGLYMDARVDNADNQEDGYTMWIGGVEYPINCDLTNGLQITVLAQAVQTAGFDNAERAFRESGMDDVDFDKELDLKFPVQLPAELQSIIDALVKFLNNPLGEGEPVHVNLKSEFYLIDAAAAAEINALASQFGEGHPILFSVEPGSTVEMQLTDSSLCENVTIVNFGGDLIIIGP